MDVQVAIYDLEFEMQDSTNFKMPELMGWRKLFASALSPRERVAEGRVRDFDPANPSSGASRHLLPEGEGAAL